MNYTLKDQYKLGIVDNCNYILSNRDDKCVYLNPYAAFILNRLVRGWTIDDLSELLSSLNHVSLEMACQAVKSCIAKVSEYLVPMSEDTPEHERQESNSPDELSIMRQSKDFLCPVSKDKIPRKLKFYLTDYCSRRCVYCFAGAKYTSEEVNIPEFLSVQRFEEIIKEAAALGIPNIEISGGDPFVITNIEKYLKVIIDYFPYDWGTSTKSFISPEMAHQLYLYGLKEMQVSIDSYRPETVNKLVGISDAFGEMLCTIRNLVSEGIKVTTKTVITSLNIMEIPQTVRYLATLGVKYMRFSYYYISANRHDSSLYPSNEQISWLNSKVSEIISFLNGKGIGTDLSIHSIYDETHRGERVICGGFTGSMSVRYDGAVLFCDSLNHCDYFTAGNLKEQGIAEVWNSQKVQDINSPEYFKEQYKGTKCYTCNIFNNCFYRRCYVRSYQRYGKYFEVDPACPFGEKDYMIR